MKISGIFILTILLLICIPGTGQTAVELSKPRLELIGENIVISYDILNSSTSDIFRVWIEVTDSSGVKLNPLSYTGDIGNRITGGNNKKISWNYGADNIIINNGVYVIVSAELISTPETTDLQGTKTEFNKPAALARSAILPGWGLSNITGNHAHILKGVAGYTCIAGAIVFNRKASSSYNDYLNSSEPTEIDNLYNTSVKHDKLSTVFAYSAIGIWVGDIIWTLTGASERKIDGLTGEAGSVSLFPSYDTGINASIVTLRLDF